MNTLTVILLVVVLLLYVKWIMIIVTFPFMAANGMRKKKPNLFWEILSVPHRCIERLCHGGWQKYVLYQLAWVPSRFIRTTAYKALGAEIADRVVIHFGTEVRSPNSLKMGGGVRL